MAARDARVRRVELTSQSDPIYPQISDRGDHLLVTLPGDWSLEPLYEELAERGQTVIKEKKSNGFWRIRVTKPPPPPDGGEGDEEPSTCTVAEAQAAGQPLLKAAA